MNTTTTTSLKLQAARTLVAYSRLLMAANKKPSNKQELDALSSKLEGIVRNLRFRYDAAKKNDQVELYQSLEYVITELIKAISLVKLAINTIN